MDRKKYIKLHRMMWEEIAERMKDFQEGRDEIPAGMDASVYFWNLKAGLIESFGEGPVNILNRCYLCAYAAKRNFANFSEGYMCDYCPVEFKKKASINDEYLDSGVVTNTCLGGLYATFLKRLADYDFEAASILAEEIASLPEKEEK